MAADVAPTKFYTKSWLVDDGLPHNSVNRVVQDRRGFLWVATAGGLARFDGREFTEYPLPMAVREATPNIRDMVADEAAGVSMLPASGGVAHVRDGAWSVHPASEALAGKILLNLFVEPGGGLWIGGGGGAIMHWREGRLETFSGANGLERRSVGRLGFARDGAGRTWIASGDFLGRYENGRLVQVGGDLGRNLLIAPSRGGGIWVSTHNRLLKWDNDRLTVVRKEAEWTVAPTNVQQLFEARDGALWIATRQGLFRFDGGRIQPVPTSHSQINSVSEDREGNLWVATGGGGIDRLRPETFVLLNSAAGFPDDLSTSVCEDATGALWCANRAGGVVRYKDGKVQVFKPAEAGTFQATNVCTDQAGNIWVGALDGLYQLPPGGGPMTKVAPALRPVRVLACLANGDLWVGWGTTTGYRLGYFRDGVYRPFGATDGFGGKHVISIAERPDGTVWIATGDGELQHYREGRFEVSLTAATSPAGRIEVLHSDSRGGLWLGTVRGLLLKRDGRMHLFSRAHGLADDFITQILEDGQGRLWLSSRRGFFCVALEELYAVADGRASRVVAMTFGRDEGLPGMSAPTGGQPMAWRARDGRLWFVTSRGLVGFDPAASLPARPSPPVFIDEVKVDHRAVPAANLRIPAGSHQVEFRFAALNFAAPEKVRVRHQLVGFDPDWVETGAERAAAYARLPPGDYTLRAIACNQDGRWNETGATLAFAVAPAWWQTWWWRAAFVLGFAGAIAWVARYWSHRRLRHRLERLEHEHELEKERARIARDLHDDLGGSLTQIGLLAERLKRQLGGADLAPGLGHLASRTRQLAGDLESIVWTVSPKNNTWDRLGAFIGRYVRGFFRDTAVECTVTGDDALPALALAPDVQHHVLAVLKESLHNVLKHAHATHVGVTLAGAGGEFTLHIADNGIGFDPAAAEHAERNGLSNMRARVADLGGDLDFRSPPGGGTEIVLRLRLAVASVPAGQPHAVP